MRSESQLSEKIRVCEIHTPHIAVQQFQKTMCGGMCRGISICGITEFG